MPKQVRNPKNVVSHSALLAKLPKLTGLSKAVVNQAVGAYFDQLHEHLKRGGEYYGAPLGLITTKVASCPAGSVRTIRFRPSDRLRQTVYKKLTAAEAKRERAKGPKPHFGGLLKTRGGRKAET